MSETPFRKAEDGSFWILGNYGELTCVRSGGDYLLRCKIGENAPILPSLNLKPAHLEITEKEPPFRAGDRFEIEGGELVLVLVKDAHWKTAGWGLLEEKTWRIVAATDRRLPDRMIAGRELTRTHIAGEGK